VRRISSSSYNGPQLTHGAVARSLCESWASCCSLGVIIVTAAAAADNDDDDDDVAVAERGAVCKSEACVWRHRYWDVATRHWRIQRLYLCIRTDWSRQELHDDGQVGAWTTRHYTTGLPITYISACHLENLSKKVKTVKSFREPRELIGLR